MEIQYLPRDSCGHVRQMVCLENERKDEEDSTHRHYHADMGNPYELLIVIADLFIVACPYAACDDRGGRKRHRHAREYLEQRHGIGYRIGGDGIRAERRYEAQNEYLAELEHAVLKPVRDADAQYLFDEPPVGTVTQRLFYMQRPLLIHQQRHDEHRSHDTGHERRNRDAFRPPVEAVDQHGVSCHVDNVHHDGDLHGHFGIAHGPEDCCSAVVQCHERDGGGHDHQICIGMAHDVLIYLSEDAVQYEILARIHDYGYGDRADCDKPYELCRCPARLLLILLAEVLSGHDRPACRQRSEEVDEQHHNLVHERYAGYGRLPHACNHNRIRHTDEHCQKLLDDKRKNQCQKRPVVKEIAAPACLYFIFHNKKTPHRISCRASSARHIYTYQTFTVRQLYIIRRGVSSFKCYITPRCTFRYHARARHSCHDRLAAQSYSLVRDS